jgi:hypothetical protein
MVLHTHTYIYTYIHIHTYAHTHTQVGTFVNLGFERAGEEDGFTYEVSLMRGNAEYFAQLQTKNTMQEEVRMYMCTCLFYVRVV